MRLLLCGTLLGCLSLPLAAQSSETGEGPDQNAPRAQPAGDMADPGASQDAEAAREKLLKAADQLDNVEANSESTKAAVDGMKTDLAKLSDQNTALTQQVSTLQDTVTRQQDEIDKIEAARAKERQALIDEVSALMAEKGAAHHAHVAPPDDDSTPAPAPKKHADDEDVATTPKPDAPSLTPPPDTSGPVHEPSTAAADETTSPPATAPATTDHTPAAPPATPRPHKGYFHVVAPHETLSLICEAYRDHGVEVTLAQIRHANGLGPHTPLKVGQKLFIPKPGA